MLIFSLNQTSILQAEQSTLTILILTYTLIIIIGTIGNAFILYIFIINIKLRTTRNAFMANLTISNLLLITICTPSYLVQFIYREWILGNFWCKLLHSLHLIIILVSAFSIMAVSIDRFILIVYSRSRRLSSDEAIIAIIIIWILSILLSSPIFFNRHTLKLGEDLLNRLQFVNQNISDNLNSTFLTSLNSYENFNHFRDTLFKTYCVEKWGYISLKHTYIIVLFGVEFVLPLVSMLIAYMWIVLFLRKQHTRMSHYEILRKRLIQKDKPHNKSCKLLSVLCLTFIICCLPLSVFNIFAEFAVDTAITIGDDNIYMILSILTTIFTINAIITPLLYGWMNINFRNEIIKYFKNKKTKCSSSYVHQKIDSKAKVNLL